MATYNFSPVPAWGSVGEFARIGAKRSSTFPVTLPGGGSATVVQGGVTKVGYLESDANGLIPAFTTTDIPSVVVNFGVGLVTIHSLEAISAGAASAAAAASSASAASTSASNASTSATNAASSAASAAAAASGAVSGKVDKGTLMVYAKDYGAVGDGIADDTSEINAAIVAAAGGIVYLSAGTYLIDATAGIKMWTANVRLRLSPGATILCAPNNASGYSMIEVNAANCVIEGKGTIQGDGTGHTGVTGEQGHCITTAAGATNLVIQEVTTTKAWGDGICVQGNPTDVSIVNVNSVDNRRNNLSITRSIRTRVYGGLFKDAGLSQNTSPSAGIDVEPNSTDQVVDCQLNGVTCSGNRGPGLQVAAATGGLAEVSINGGRSIGSTTAQGFYATGPADTIRAKVNGLLCKGNAVTGFTLLANKVVLNTCEARANTQVGFLVQDSDCVLSDIEAIENGRNGVTVASSAVLNTHIRGARLRANSQTTHATYFNLDDFGTGTVMSDIISDAGTLTNKPAYGYVFRTGSSGARVFDCTVEGTFATSNYLDQVGNTFMMPRIGATTPGFAGVTTTTTAPAAGGAGALPATPLGYALIELNGTVRKVAYYANP